MKTIKLKNRSPGKKHKIDIVLPKSYIDQEPVTIKHERSHSLTNSFFENNINQEIENNNAFRFQTERKSKKVSFNKKIQIINIDNFKNGNRMVYEKDFEEDKKENTTRENRCISCIII